MTAHEHTLSSQAEGPNIESKACRQSPWQLSKFMRHILEAWVPNLGSYPFLPCLGGALRMGPWYIVDMQGFQNVTSVLWEAEVPHNLEPKKASVGGIIYTWLGP